MKENEYLVSYGAYREFQNIVDNSVNGEDLGVLAEMLGKASTQKWTPTHRDDGLVVVEFQG